MSDMKIPKGKVGIAKSIAKMAEELMHKSAEGAGMKAPVVANTELTNVQDFHTSLGDQIRSRAMDMQKTMEGFDYKYDKGHRVFTKDSSEKNRPPFEILRRTIIGNQPMREDSLKFGPRMGKPIKDPVTGKTMRTPWEPGYRVRHQIDDDLAEFDIPQSAIIGDVEMKNGGPVKMGRGGIAKSIADMIKEIKQTRGGYEAKRLERAADEVPNLERLYQKDALDQLFRGDNAKGIMTMRPGDFERYARPLDYDPKSPKHFMFGETVDPVKGSAPKNLTQEEYLRYLAGLKGFSDVPFLEVNKLEPKNKKATLAITGHEGRHRNRALDAAGEQAGLVQFYPRASLREDFPRRYREDYINALREELEKHGRMVTPENDLTPEGAIIRPAIELPDVYQKGGAVRKADGGIMDAIEAAKMTGNARDRIPLSKSKAFEFHKPLIEQRLGKAQKTVEEMRRELGIPDRYVESAPEGAAFGVYPQLTGSARRHRDAMSGQRNEQINPLRIARGIATSTLGQSGDIEELVRSLLPKVSEDPFLPTTKEVSEYLPFKPETDVEKRAEEVGNLFGDIAYLKAPFLLAKGAASAGKALAPNAGKLAEQYMMRTGMALPMDAWHGSPHRFPPTAKNPLGEFDPKKIGTGEGAQAYGHGSYLAESPGVAKSYRDKLSDGFTFPGGTKLDSSALTDMGFKTPQVKAIISSLNLHQGDVAKASQTIRGNASYLRYGSAEQNSLQKAADFVSGIKANELPSSGFLYKVDLPDEQIAKMLDWDKPLSEQAPNIQAAINKQADIDAAKYGEGGGMDYYRGDPDSHSGESIYHYLTEQNSGAIPTSEMLREMGIPGIKYLDAGSRDVGEGTRNFVVFPGNEDILTIKERMKKGGPVSLDAMRMAVGGMAEGGFRPTKAGIIRRTVEEARRLHEAAQKTRSKAAQQEAGLYHPIGGGVKLSKPTELMTSKTVANPKVNPVQRRIITPEDMQGGIALPLIGDRAAAGRILTEIGGKRLSKPVELQGGPGFMQTHTMPNDESAAWASGQGVISRLGGLTRMAADMGGTDKIYAPYVSMSQTGVDFNAMVTQAILGQYDPSSLTKKAKKDFLNDIRNYVPDKKKPNIKPGSVLTDADLNDVDALREKMLLPDAGPLRKVFVERMGIKQFQNQGFPDVAAARLATTEPDLLNVDVGSTGYNIARLNPEGRIIKSPLIPHETYPEQLGGEYFGSLDQPVSYKEFFPGFADAQRLFGKPEKHDWYTFGRTMPLQQLDQEWVDRVMKSMGKDAPREWKKGGAIKKASGGMLSMPQKAMRAFVEAGKKAKLAEKSQEAVADGKLFVPDEAAKKAMREALDQAGPKEYAAGGQITADDLIIEERKL